MSLVRIQDSMMQRTKQAGLWQEREAAKQLLGSGAMGSAQSPEGFH